MNLTERRYYSLLSIAGSWQRAFEECGIIDVPPLEKISPTVIGVESVRWGGGYGDVFMEDGGPSVWDRMTLQETIAEDEQERDRECEAIAVLAAALAEAMKDRAMGDRARAPL